MAVGNAHPLYRKVLGRESCTETILSRLYVGRKVKRVWMFWSLRPKLPYYPAREASECKTLPDARAMFPDAMSGSRKFARFVRRSFNEGGLRLPLVELYQRDSASNSRTR